VRRALARQRVHGHLYGNELANPTTRIERSTCNVVLDHQRGITGAPQTHVARSYGSVFTVVGKANWRTEDVHRALARQRIHDRRRSKIWRTRRRASRARLAAWSTIIDAT
jgi:hypothetical protein